MSKNPIFKNILLAVAVAIFGFLLLNLTFVFDFLFQSLADSVVKLFTSVDFNMTYKWFPLIKHAMFVIIIGLISWPILRSKLGTLYKAIYLTVPAAVVLVTLGIFLYRWPIVSYLTGALLTLGTLYYFYRTRQPWLYHYAVILVGLALMIFSLSGGEI